MRNRPKVLIVDYQADVLITFERLFEDAGFDTTTSWSGLDALKLSKTSPFDLVLVNEHLSDVPAAEFVQQMAAIGMPCMIMQGSRPQQGARLSSLAVAGVVSKRSPADVIVSVSAKLGLAKSADRRTRADRS